MLRADISLSPTTANAASAGAIGSMVQIITSNQSITWTATVNQGWLTFTSSASGKGNGSITYSVAGNPNGTSRVATINVTPSSGTAATLVVTQLAGSLSVSPSSSNADPSGITGLVTVATDDPSLQWTAVSNSAWLTVTSGSTGIGTGSVGWSAAANNTNSDRTGIITVTPLGGIGQTFTVSQPHVENPVTSVNPTSATVDGAGGKGSVSVSITDQTIMWTATSNESWLTISSGSGTGNGSFSYTAAPNPQAVSRSATITVNPSRGPSVTFAVTQSGGVLTVSPTSASVPAAGGTGTVTLTTTDTALGWTVTSNQTWLTVAPPSSGQGSANVQWSAAANTSANPRSATLTITPTGGTGQIVSISQAGAISGTLTLNPSSASAPASVSNGSVVVTSTNQSLSWTVTSSDQSWLTISSGASGTGNGMFQYTATGNTTAAQRTATITVTPTNGTATAVTFVVTQDATTVTISPSSATAAAAGDTGSFKFTTNNSTMTWTAKAPGPQTWLSLTSAVSGVADATMTWAATANTSPTSRTATITITPTVGQVLVFTVTQQGLTGTITVTPSPVAFSYQQLTTPPTDVQLQVGGTAGLSFSPSATTASGGAWLSVTGTTPATTPGVINVSVQPSGLAAGTYTGTVTITSGGATNSPVTVPVTLTVTAAPVLTAQPNSVSFAYQQNGAQPKPRTVQLSTSGMPPLPVDFTIMSDPDAPWLSVTGTSPSPATLTLSVDPTGLQPGTYQATITVNAPLAGNSPFTIPVTFTVSAAPTLIAAPQSLSVTYRQLDPLPGPVVLGVTSSGDNFSYSADVSPSGSWLSITGINAATRAAGQTPSNIQISINPTGLAPGNYQGSVVLMSASANNSLLTEPVTLTVLPAATLTPQPQHLNFSLTAGVDTGTSASIAVSSDSTVSFTAGAQTASGGNWLSVLSSGGQAPATLTVSIQSTGLAPGIYLGSITLTSAQAANSPVVIPVTLTISVQPRLTAFPTQLTYFYQLQSSFPTDQFVLIGTSNLMQAPVTISTTTTSGGSWLSATNGTTTPGLAQVTVNPAGLGAGTYSGSVTLTSPGLASVTLPVTFRIVSAPVLTVQPTQLTFSYQQNGSAAAAQSVAVSSSATPLSFSVATAPGASWLSVTGGGQTPSNFSVSVNPQGLAPGSYSGTVMVTSTGAGNSPVLVPVQLIVTSAPLITVQPTSLSFTYQPGGTVPLAQAVHLSSGQSLSFSISILPQVDWLIVEGDSATPGTLNASVDPSGLTTGQYTASILVNTPGAANSPVVVPVTLTIQAAGTIVPSPAQFTFSYQMSGPQPSNQVLSIGDSTLVATAAASTTSGGNWLSVTGGGSAGALFSVTANPSNLSAGTYQGTVTLNAANAGNSPLNVPVALVVTAAPVLSAAPAQLSFSYQIGNAPPPSASFQLTSSGSPLTFQVAATTDSGASWLMVSGGTTTTATVTAAVNPAGLAPGTYTGTITVSSDAAGNSPLLVPVTFTVATTETLTASPTSLQFNAQVQGASPPSQTFHLTSSGAPFAVTYAVSPDAPWLSFTGSPTAPGDVSVTVSSGALAAGTYTAVISVQSSFAANSPLAIPVTLVVSATPVLTALPSTLLYTYTLLGPKPTRQMFTVSGSGGPVDYTVSVVPGPSWLFGSGTGTTPGSVSVTVDPGVLTPGSYQGAILITPTNGGAPIQVPVTLTVASAPILSSQPASLAFAYQINGPLPQAAALVVSSSQGSQAIAVGSQTFSGGDWLITSGGGGNTPAAVTASVNPAGLSPGVYQEQIVITANGVANSPLLIPATLTVSSAPAMIATPSSLSFAAQLNGSPANQQITLTSSDGSALPIGSVVASGGGGALTVSTSSNTTPATLTVSVSTANITAGVYQASIVVSAPTAGNSTLTIPVVLTLSALPGLLVSPPSAVFAYSAGTTPPQPASLAVSSTSTQVAYATAVAPGSPWLSVTGSGTTPSTLQISVDPSGLTPGAYYGTVLVTSTGTANSVVTVPVSLIVSTGPVLTSSSPSLTFSTTPSGSPPPQTLQIISTGSLSITTSASPSTPWLSVTGSGSLPQVVTVSVNTTGLSPGVYQGSVQVYATGAGNSPLTIPVILVINAVASLQASPSPVSFNYQPGGTAPAPQTVGVTLGGQPATDAQSTVAPGTPWLSVTGGAAGSISITANPTGLLSGTYTGTVVVSNNGAANNPLTIPVTLTVAGATIFDLSQDALAFTAVTAQSQPMTTTVTLTTGTNPPVSFSSNVTASTWLTISPLNGMTPATMTVTVDPTGLRPGSYSGSVIVSSSSNVIRTIPVNLAVADAPNLNVSPPFLELSYSHGGNPPNPVNVYVARFGTDLSVLASANVPWITVNPSTPSTSGPVTVTVDPAGLAAGIYQGIVTLTLTNPPPGTTPVPSKQLPVTLYVDQPANPEIISVLSAMNFLDTPLGPGLIFTVLGTDLGPATPMSMQIQPGQTVSQLLGGVQVLINGIPCPLLYVSSGQINAIAPFALYNKTGANVQVRYLGLLSDPLPVLVSPSAAGLFAFSQAGAGQGAILNQDQSVNTPTNPAAKGTIISLFGGGGGQTTPQGIDGLITSPTLLPQLMLPVSVTIGDVPATDISYAGAAPDLVSGAVQVNVRIPTSVASGAQPVVLRIGNTLSQTNLTVSVQ